MSKKERERLEKLALQCAAMLTLPVIQSMDIWRGDMRAIVAAYKQIQKATR